jgi:hypothetical protein
MSGSDGAVSSSQVPSARPTWEHVVTPCLIWHEMTTSFMDIGSWVTCLGLDSWVWRSGSWARAELGYEDELNWADR